MGKWHRQYEPDGELTVHALRRKFGDVFPQLGLVRSTAFKCHNCGLRFPVPGVGAVARGQANVRWRKKHPLCVRGEDPVRRGAGAQRGSRTPDPPHHPCGCKRQWRCTAITFAVYKSLQFCNDFLRSSRRLMCGPRVRFYSRKTPARALPLSAQRCPRRQSRRLSLTASNVRRSCISPI